MKTELITLQGHHKYNEDSCKVVTNPFLCGLLSDGVSNCKYGRQTSKALVENVYKLILNEYDCDSYVFEELLYHTIIDTLNDLKNHYKGSDDDFGATLIGCYQIKNRLRIFHCGDGGVLARSKNLPIMILSYPDNHESGAVYQAGYSKEHIHMIEINIEHIDEIILCTDGFLDGYLNESIFEQRILQDHLNKPLTNIIMNYHRNELNIQDDISLIRLQFEHPIHQVLLYTPKKKKLDFFLILILLLQIVMIGGMVYVYSHL